jgi:uncharacterized protein Yka (UPF0111/DUF47 family)
VAPIRLTPREGKYFPMFSEMVAHISEASRVLEEMFSDTGGDYTGYVPRLKSIERACDELAHSVSNALNTSFITPFDREDIYMLSSALDDVVDLIDDAGRAMLMYNLHESTPHARQFAGVIRRMAERLDDVIPMLEKPDGITPKLVEIHRLENEGDDIYQAAVSELFRGTPDPLHVLKWKEIYEKLESAIDRCERVANIIESVIIKQIGRAHV